MVAFRRARCGWIRLFLCRTYAGGGCRQRHDRTPEFAAELSRLFRCHDDRGPGCDHPASLRPLPERIRALGDLELGQYIDRIVEHVARRDSVATGNALFDAASDRYTNLLGLSRIIALVLAIAAAGTGFYFARRRLSLNFRARARVEDGIKFMLFLCAAIAILTTIGIVGSLFFEALRFFSRVPVLEFVFGTEWNAQTGADFGAIPLFFGTFMIAFLAMLVAAPIGLLSAIYLSEYASPRFRSIVKPVLELLAGIPTVVYGFFALQFVAPLVRSAATGINALPFVPDGFLAAQPTSALAAGLVMGIMIIPFESCGG